MARRNTVLLSSGVLVFAALFSLLFCSQAIGGVDLRMDLDTEYGSYPNLWNSLNNYTTDGNHHYMAVGSDAHEAEIVAAGNGCCAYWNNMNTGYANGQSGTTYANTIAATVSDYWSGDPPTWIILNEIAKTNWKTIQAYRDYVTSLSARLNALGYNPIICSPLIAPDDFGADWRKICGSSGSGFVGIERYLSGQEIMNTYNTIAKCQAEYQDAKDHYTALLQGFGGSRLFLIEHFGQTASGADCGRASISVANWSSAIHKRAQGSHNVGFHGFVGYAWSGIGENGYGTETEQCSAVGSASVYRPY